MDDKQRASWVSLRDNLRRHAAEIEDEIAGIGRLQRDVRYDREAGRHRRQEAVNSTMDWAGPSGKRLRGSVTGEATGMKRQQLGHFVAIRGNDGHRPCRRRSRGC